MDYYPTISAEETKNKEINLDLNKKLVRFTTHFKNTSTTRNTHTKQNNGIYNTCHGLLSQEWIDGKNWSLLWYVMLIKVMNSTYIWFRVVLVSSRNILSGRLYWPELQHLRYKTKKHTRTEEPLNKVPNSGILRHAPELKPYWKIIDTICLSPL